MWAAGRANVLLETDFGRALDQIERAEHHAEMARRPASVAARRSRCLADVRDKVNLLLLHGIDVSQAEALRCDDPLVRDACVALEAAIEFQLLPPLFSLSDPTVSLVLWHLQQEARCRSGGSMIDSLQLPAEAVALARGLCEKHLALTPTQVAFSSVRDRYAARLWVCLGLQRRVLAEWVEAIGAELARAYAEGALMTTADDFGILIDLLRPLSHIAFTLPEGAPHATQLANFLGLPSSATRTSSLADEFLPPDSMLGAASRMTTKPSNLMTVDSLLNPPSLASTMRVQSQTCRKAPHAHSKNLAFNATAARPPSQQPSHARSGASSTDRVPMLNDQVAVLPYSSASLQPRAPTASMCAASSLKLEMDADLLACSVAAAIIASALEMNRLHPSVHSAMASGTIPRTVLHRTPSTTAESSTAPHDVNSAEDLPQSTTQVRAEADDQQTSIIVSSSTKHSHRGHRRPPVTAEIMAAQQSTPMKASRSLGEEAAAAAVAAVGSTRCRPFFSASDHASKPGPSPFALDEPLSEDALLHEFIDFEDIPAYQLGSKAVPLVMTTDYAYETNETSPIVKTDCLDAEADQAAGSTLDLNYEIPLEACADSGPVVVCDPVAETNASSDDRAQKSCLDAVQALSNHIDRASVTEEVALPCMRASESPNPPTHRLNEHISCESGTTQICTVQTDIVNKAVIVGAAAGAADTTPSEGASQQSTFGSTGADPNVAGRTPLERRMFEHLTSGRYTSSAAVELRSEAGALWGLLMQEADVMVERCEGESAETLLGASGTADRLLLSDASRLQDPSWCAETSAMESGSSPSSNSTDAHPFVLRQVSNRRGAHVMIGISGLLSKHEGGMELSTQPMQLAACWAAAAAFFKVCDWWSLSWGGAPLAALASGLQLCELDDNAADARTGMAALIPQLLPQLMPQVRALRPAWVSAYQSAKAAGRALAAHLVARGCGRRPITLLGVSLGARVVWECLQTLVAMPNRAGAGIVQDVLLMVAPVTSNHARWEHIAAVVAGRLVNAYVPDDAQLGLLYRIDHPTSVGCCGLAPVRSKCVENYDASDHVAESSQSYHFAVPAVLEGVGLLPTALS